MQQATQAKNLADWKEHAVMSVQPAMEELERDVDLSIVRRSSHSRRYGNISGVVAAGCQTETLISQWRNIYEQEKR
jgi:hypothetical protein